MSLFSFGFKKADGSTPAKSEKRAQPSSARKSPAAKRVKAPVKTPVKTPVKKQSARSTPRTPKTPSRLAKTPSKKSAIDAKDEIVVAPGAAFENDAWMKPWMRNKRDAKRRTPDDPEYNPTTLYIPESFFKGLSPGQQQYYRFKQSNYDTVLFFKVGKFYEIFDEDAVLCHRELGLLYMAPDKGRPHVGFPEQAFARFAPMLTQMGHRVAVVEQMETPDELKAHNKALPRGSKDRRKCVRRDLCRLLTPGTVSDPSLVRDSDARFCLAVTERRGLQGDTPFEFGVAFVDACAGRVFLGQFADDRSRSQMRTLLARIRPNEFLVAGDISETTMRILRKESPRCAPTKVCDDQRFDAATVLEELVRKREEYFPEVQPAALDGVEVLAEGASLPEAITTLRDSDSDVGMEAFGVLLPHLRRAMKDRETLSFGRIALFTPGMDLGVDTTRQGMLLDGQTLDNLEILMNDEGTISGSLLAVVQRTITPGGRRQLRQWLQRPLLNSNDINDRLDAVEELMRLEKGTHQHQSVLSWASLKNDWASMPDIERLLARIHGVAAGSQKTPVMFVNTANKRHIQHFVQCCEGLRTAMSLKTKLRELRVESKLLRSLLDALTDLTPVLDHFENCFDVKEALKTGSIEPRPGASPAFDRAQEELERIHNVILEEGRKKIQTLGLSGEPTFFVHAVRAREKYQLELKDATTNKVDADVLDAEVCDVGGKLKGRSRYSWPKLDELRADYNVADQEKSRARKAVMRDVFAQFASHRGDILRVCEVLANLDALLSLALVSNDTSEGPMCRPTFVREDSDGVVFDLRGGRHPCVRPASGQFVPNDVYLGGGKAKCALITGPNMGGKSTLIRTVCVIVVLAQLGCFVPAKALTLSPVDRIFTRVGANDRIVTGQSTFQVELEETANIMRHATERSLVVLDELGRGTSTWDGTGIAYAVLRHMVEEIKARTLFSTHYHVLTDDFEGHADVANFHMAYRLSEDHQNDARVTFLFKFVPGACKSSFGMNVARLAGLPASIVRRAAQVAQEFEVHCQKGMVDEDSSHGSSTAALDVLDGEEI